jgi:hypothetical protein
MKTLRSNIALMTTVTWFIVTAAAGSTCREFSSTNGCTIKGILLDYSFRDQVATIQREGRTDPCKVSIDVFCKADRSYIRSWALERDFRQSLNVSSRLVGVECEEEIRIGRYDPRFIRSHVYELEMSNLSESSFTNVEIEYCLFYRQITRNGATKYRHEGVLCSGIKVGTVDAGSSKRLQTQAVLTYNEECDEGLFGSNGASYGEILGIWLRLTATPPSGEALVRDLRFPDDLNHHKDWTTTSSCTELNRRSGPSGKYLSSVDPAQLPAGFRFTVN